MHHFHYFPTSVAWNSPIPITVTPYSSWAQSYVDSTSPSHIVLVKKQSQASSHKSRSEALEEVCIVINGLLEPRPSSYATMDPDCLFAVPTTEPSRAFRETTVPQTRRHTSRQIFSPQRREGTGAAGEHKNLETLEVYGWPISSSPLLLQNLVPVLQCSSLTLLRVWVGKSVNMNDEDMKTVASRLPRLQVLSLIGCEPRINPSITFRSLASVVASCPDLRSLQLQVDGSSKPPNHDLIPHSALLELNLGGSREPLAHEIPAVAAFLDQLSCAKGSPHTAHWKGRPTPDAWCHVFDLIKKLQNTGDRSRGG